MNLLKTLGNKSRVAVGILTASTALVTSIAVHEGYSEKAIIPVKGDVPTIGHGTTTYPDGTKVKIQDTITRKQAEEYLKYHIDSKSIQIKKCFNGVSLTQGEFDAYISLAYNVGASAVCKSSIPRKLKAGQYEEACKTLLQFNKFNGKELRGLTIRRQSEYKQCMSWKQ